MTIKLMVIIVKMSKAEIRMLEWICDKAKKDKIRNKLFARI